MMELRLYPHAKINIGLLIKGKRPDGYHLLQTLLFPIPALHDELYLRPASNGGCNLQLDGIQLDSQLEDNLVHKAYRALKEQVPELPGVQISLKKSIPAGAGLGGGSSDAAFTLKGLNQLFELGMSKDALAAVGARLGADVPFFLYDRPLMAEGIGTELTPIEWELPYTVKVVTPPIHSSTIAAYKALRYQDFDPRRDLYEILKQPPDTWKEQLVNDLEVPVFEMYPELIRGKGKII